VFGIEIVAFVSSVGKIHLPYNTASSQDQDSDDDADAVSPEFLKLISTITREEIDKHPTRCPHPETADRMTQVSVRIRLEIPSKVLICLSASSERKMLNIPLVVL